MAKFIKNTLIFLFIPFIIIGILYEIGKTGIDAGRQLVINFISYCKYQI